MRSSNKISLTYLFFTFLKIGSIAWGGFMALIAVVEKQLVGRDKVIKGEMILDGISLASVLPGPVAFNVVTYLGYRLRGLRGALVSMAGIILPSFIMILILASLYSKYGELPVFNRFFQGILPAITAVVLSVAVTMVQKQVKDYKQIIICALAGLVMIFFHLFYVTLLVIIFSGVTGFLLFNDSAKVAENPKTAGHPINFRRIAFFTCASLILLLGIGLLIILIAPADKTQFKLLQTIFLAFSGMSLTLFGGGYVIIPAIQQVIVDGLHWLTINEFSDAIAMGQITPGPILISATFIGFHVAGFLGACVATVAIFLPPGIVMIIFSGLLSKIKDSPKIIAIFKGMRPAIIGMIISAAFTIGKGAVMAWPSAVIFLIVFILLVRYKINVVWLIPLSGVAGVIFL